MRQFLVPVCAVVAIGGFLLLVRVSADEADDPFGNGADATGKSNISVGPSTSARCTCTDDNPAAQRISDVLGGQLSQLGIDFTEIPLEEVINSLQHEYDIPIQLDRLALDDVGISSDEPININARNVSLKSALRLMLRQLDLTYRIRDEMLLITTFDAAHAEPQICVYDVRDLVPAVDGKRDLQPLADTILACVATRSWATNGGDGQLKILQPGMLVVAQIDGIHDEVRHLLATLRKMMDG